eukprot:CAMPEP_0168593898 /NCGR_PEP_ID=MMETSP0420-20121227/8585_1 /TAXON_ID=498008 /ORGANISM="Pessonella sp." /LENGTH=107 /DNA_ID=CAMNT_0008630131 /DNA_START=407 /DNA_END=730 /DNA_ORIENTATION=+
MLGTNIDIVIAGNKIDLQRERVVSIEEAERYAASVGAKHFSTSAKLNKGINEMFLNLTRALLKSSSKKGGSAGGGGRSGGGRGGRGGLVITDDFGAPAQKTGGGCCG